jgi:hypothetical protein
MRKHLTYLFAGLLALLPWIFHRSNLAVAAEKKVVMGYDFGPQAALGIR